MFFAEIFFVLVIVAALTGIFGAGVSRHRGSALFAFFLLLFTLTWAAGLWIVPIGPPVMGVYWAPFLLAGFLFSILLIALIPFSRPRVTGSRESTAESEREIFGVFFWILLVVLFLVIVTGYL